MNYQITDQNIRNFALSLQSNEKAPGTIENYVRHVTRFSAFLQGAPISKEATAQWKQSLMDAGYCPATINAMLVSVNTFLKFNRWEMCCVKLLRLQRKMFRPAQAELTREEYTQLMRTARETGRQKLALIMETICATGIRVSELRYITAEAVRCGRAQVNLKGKIRTILIPEKLRQKLKSYADKQKIASGEIFLSGSGCGMDRRQIWAQMKALGGEAGVDKGKIFPHNLRHLFAVTFYNACKDIVRLADVLGHSNMETTRIYLISSECEHIRQLESLGLMT